MGYYSLYKIIKDFFRTIFGNKILKFTFIFILFMLIFLFFNKNKVNASSSLELTGGSITLPSWVDSSSYNAYIFQSAIDTNNKYYFLTIFTRGGGYLKLGTYGNDTAFTTTGNGLSISTRNNKFSNFYGSVAEYQTFINTYFSSNNLSWSTWTTYSDLNYFDIDAENCYINGTQDILNSDNSVYIQGNNLYIPESLQIYPYFENVTEIENGNPDGVIIDSGEFSNTDNLYFHLLEIQTGVSTADNSIYYYLDKTFILNKDSDYYSTMLADPNVFYYFIPRYKLGLSQDSSYLYVLNNSKNQIQNSHGLISIDKSNGIFDVISSDTTGVITATEEESDRMKNIEESIANNENTINNINNTINNTNITEDTETEIDTNLNYNNNNESLTLLNNGFFTRLTNLLSNISNYNLNEDTTISLPLPNSNESLVLHSIDLNNNINGTLRTIINAFWTYIFTFYLWKFINKIYISITTGNILDSFSSSGEAITNNML